MDLREESEAGPSTSTANDPNSSRIKSSAALRSEVEQTINKNSNHFSNAFSEIKKLESYEDVSTKKVPTNPELHEINPQTKIPSKNCVIVNSRQRGNPILKFIRNAPWEFGEIVPDYVMGNTTCAMFLSLRYHTLNPNYIHERLKILGRQYELRVLLVQVDVKEPHLELKQLTKICVFADLTLMLAWSPEEAGRIIEVYKIFENKPPDLIMEKQDVSTFSQMIDALTTIRVINRTDAMTLLSNFGSLEKIVEASEEELSLCPGLGPQKASKLHSVLHQSFKKY